MPARLRILRDVALEGADDTSPVQPKRLLLLAYLLLEGRHAPVRRERLLALFWPEATTERARTSLRQSLFSLRTLLGADAVVTVGTGELRVDGALLTCDALELLEAAERNDFRTVAALHRTELLAGITGGDSTDLEHWLEDARSRFRRLAAHAVRMLAADPTAPSAERRAWLERLLELEPYDEAALVALVTLLLMAGERPAAVEAHRRFVTRLKADLDLDPSPAVQRLLEDARRATAAGAPAPVAPGAPPSAHPGERPTVSVVRRWLPGAAAAVGLLGVGVGLASWGSTVRQPTPTLIEVRPFAAEAPDSGTAAYAGLVEAKVRGALARIDGFRLLGQDAGRRAPLLPERPGTVVRGGVQPVGDRWLVWAEVTASESDLLLVRTDAVVARGDTLPGAVLDRLAAAVATRRDMTLHWGETLHRPTSLASLEAFARGMEALNREALPEAASAFGQAWRLDSSFVFAGLMAVTAIDNLGRQAVADSLLRPIEARAGTLLPLERAQARRVRAILNADLGAFLTESRALIDLEPDAPFLMAQYAADALLANAPGEALRATDRLPTGAPDVELGRMPQRATALHLLGRYQRELATVDRGIALARGIPHYLNFRVPPLAALGRVDTLRQVLAAAEAAADGRNVPRLIRAAGLELVAHGHEAAGRELLGRAAALVRADPAFPGRTRGQRLRTVETLLDAGADSLALAVLAGVGADRSSFSTEERSLYLALRGLAEAHLGDTSAARATADTLGTQPTRFRFGADTYRRARIHAAAGDDEVTLRLLDQAQREGFIAWREVHLDLDLRRLQGLPRFRAFAAPRG